MGTWPGLDPLMAQIEVDKGSRNFLHDPNPSTYGIPQKSGVIEAEIEVAGLVHALIDPQFRTTG